MTESSNTRHIRSFAADQLAGLGIFGIGTTLVSGTSAFADTFTFASPDSPPFAIASASSGSHTVLVLGLVFSVLFAFNAAFFRHLGRAYSQAPRDLD